MTCRTRSSARTTAVTCHTRRGRGLFCSAASLPAFVRCVPLQELLPLLSLPRSTAFSARSAAAGRRCFNASAAHMVGRYTARHHAPRRHRRPPRPFRSPAERTCEPLPRLRHPYPLCRFVLAVRLMSLLYSHASPSARTGNDDQTAADLGPGSNLISRLHFRAVTFLSHRIAAARPERLSCVVFAIPTLRSALTTALPLPLWGKAPFLCPSHHHDQPLSASLTQYKLHIRLHV